MNAKTATKPAAPASPPATVPNQPNAAQAAAYKVGKAYNARPTTAQDNAATWALLTQCIAANKGQATRAQLEEIAKQRNHVPFVGYCIRRGYLATA